MVGVIMTAGEYGWLRRFEMTIQGWEWIIILVIVLLVFGVGRISKLGNELGKGISAFREGVREGQDENEDEDTVDAKEKLE